MARCLLLSSIFWCTHITAATSVTPEAIRKAPHNMTHNNSTNISNASSIDTSFGTTLPPLPELDIHYSDKLYVAQQGDILSTIARDWGRSTGQSSQRLTLIVTEWLINNNGEIFSGKDAGELSVGDTLYLPLPTDVGLTIEQEAQEAEKALGIDSAEPQASRRYLALETQNPKTANLEVNQSPSPYRSQERTTQYSHDPLLATFTYEHNPSATKAQGRTTQLWLQGALFGAALMVLQFLFWICRALYNIRRRNEANTSHLQS